MLHQHRASTRGPAGPHTRRAGTSRAAGVALVLAVVAAACSTSSTGEVVEQLMTQTAAGGTWTSSGDGHTLTLTDVSPSTVVFTDRPERRAGSMSTAAFVEAWTDEFGDDPPNAAIVLSEGSGDADTVIATLSSPTYDAAARTLRYAATLIGAAEPGLLGSFVTGADAVLPSSFDAVSVFIDGTDAQMGSSATTTTTPPKTCDTAGSPTTPVKMSIVNNSGYPDDQVYVALTGVQLSGSLPGGDPMPTWDADPTDLINASVPLTCLEPDTDVPGGHAYMFELGQGIGSGLLWVSLGSPVTTDLPVTQPSFDTTDYRFANVEFAYPGQGDMTNVDQFSFPIDLETYGSSSTDASSVPIETSTYRAGTCRIVEELQRAVDDAKGGSWDQVVVNDGDSNFVRVVSPKQRAQQLAVNGTPPHSTPNPFAQGWPSLEEYMDSMVGTTLQVEGLYTPGAGSPDAADSGWYAYSATYGKDEVTLSGTIRSAITVGPDPKKDRAGSGAIDGKPMSIALDGVNTDQHGNVTSNNDLLTGLYDQSSRYVVDGVPRNGMTKGTAELAAPDDVYNSIYRDFVTAFTYGYWGGTYGTSNGGFWQRVEPPEAPAGGQPSFGAARPKGTGETFLPYNLYSKVMYGFSDNYNIPYGEDYGSGAPSRPSPLLDVPTGGTWRMTIQSDGTTEECPSSGFRPGGPPDTPTTSTSTTSTSTTSTSTAPTTTQPATSTSAPTGGSDSGSGTP